jgi:hypothetical protein
MALRDLIKERLAALKLTQSHLAALIDRHPSYITDIMSGRKHRVQSRFVLPLAKALQIPPDDLYRAMTTVVPPVETAARSLTVVEYVGLSGDLIAAWHKPDQILLPSGPGKVVPVFRTMDELRTGKSQLAYRWPLTLGWNPAAYGLLNEAYNSNSIYGPIGFEREIVLVAPEIEIRRNDVCIAYLRRRLEFSPTLVGQFRDRGDNDVEIFATGRKYIIPIKDLIRIHRILAIFDANV